MAWFCASGAHVRKVRSAPVLEPHHFRLAIARTSTNLWRFKAKAGAMHRPFLFDEGKHDERLVCKAISEV
jgi:trans-aconitate 2-methyltransferase